MSIYEAVMDCVNQEIEEKIKQLNASKNFFNGFKEWIDGLEKEFTDIDIFPYISSYADTKGHLVVNPHLRWKTTPYGLRPEIQLKQTVEGKIYGIWMYSDCFTFPSKQTVNTYILKPYAPDLIKFNEYINDELNTVSNDDGSLSARIHTYFYTLPDLVNFIKALAQSLSEGSIASIKAYMNNMRTEKLLSTI
jgi:hypothetical protein